jgi:NhaA family Na+:H+ antiporter
VALPAGRFIFAVVRPVQRFFRLEAAGGIVLIVAALAALILANSGVATAYLAWVHMPLHVGAAGADVHFTIHELINDGLMTIFFVVAGMEIKREIVGGELRTLRRAALPLIGAAGGMLVPALIYLALNGGDATARRGWAIPTATDIAFALGCLSLLKKRVPWSLFVFLTALAIFDDLGAILVIALAYGSTATASALVLPIALTALLFVLARARVHRPWPYVVIGAFLWLAVGRAGLHPTLAGVVVGLAIPSTGKRSVDETLGDLDVAVESLRQLPAEKAEGALEAIANHVRAMQPPVERLLHGLHAPVAFGIVPLFALVNAGVPLGGGHLEHTVTGGVAAALVLGKCIGVLGGVFLATRAKIAPLPTGARWSQVIGVALLAGIGFTMSLFVTELAFGGEESLQRSAKVGILLGSFASSLLGLGILRFAAPKHEPQADDVDVLHLDLPRFASGYRVASWETTTEFAGQTLLEADLRRRFGVTVLGVYRTHDEVTADGTAIRKLEALEPSYALAPGETLLLVGDQGAVDRFITSHSAANPDPA